MYKDFVYFVIFDMKKIIKDLLIMFVFILSIVTIGHTLASWGNGQWTDPDGSTNQWTNSDGSTNQWTNSNDPVIPWTNPDGPTSQWGWSASQWDTSAWDNTNPSDCSEGQSYQSGWRTLCCPYPLEGGSCPSCPSNRRYTVNWQPLCCPGTVENWECTNNLPDVWINISAECLLNWQCSFNAYKAMWIRQSNENPTVLWFFQDITLTTTTVALWTFVVVAMVLAWLYWAVAAVTGKDTKKPKTILISCFVWILLVMWSYAIIRLIQFLATAWS